jgi:hypothetical protein
MTTNKRQASMTPEEVAAYDAVLPLIKELLRVGEGHHVHMVVAGTLPATVVDDHVQYSRFAKYSGNPFNAVALARELVLRIQAEIDADPLTSDLDRAIKGGSR